MYNRYIPQPDGSFKRSRMSDNRSAAPPPPKPSPEPECKPEPPQIPQQPCKHHPRTPTARKPQVCIPSREENNAAGFLRKLLPKEFDTGDLMIVLLILLMAGDCADDKNTALLTLALYFLM